ncbi:MAG: hypothetical protein PHN49_00590 [Candidatus Omnitrophica bacterium]|nr:hypothetical protein [Candidatus Omnitrophota bacterium]MDD5670119.1 hypothetical protein [Candidatus Omnitrophota bacterium]
MNPLCVENATNPAKVEPLCPVFGACGGCAYQDIPYDEELRIKEKELQTLFRNVLGTSDDIFETIVASPEPYYYRHRLDIGLYRDRQGGCTMGFMQEGTHRIVSVDSCAISQQGISEFLPQLKVEASQKMPADYRVANLVVKIGGDGRVVWGGIGRKSLAMNEADYLWTVIEGKKVYYSLDTFFQANLSILPRVVQQIRKWLALDAGTLFLDLYAGVGLFGLCLADSVCKVVMVEESKPSARLAKYNVDVHHLSGKAEILPCKVEEALLLFMAESSYATKVALIDPPRVGLSESVLQGLALDEENPAVGGGRKWLDALLYLSCSPETLVRDLTVLSNHGWRIVKAAPFDFFPRTKHLETLVLLQPLQSEGKS